MADEINAPTKGAGPWGQAFAAVALVAALGAGLWAIGETSSPASDPGPATCSGGEPDQKPKESEGASRQASGAQLCEALNRADLAELLGTPGDIAKSASGSDGSVARAGGTETATPSARVQLGTYTVTLTATYDRLPVGTYATLLGDAAQKRKVLDRPAVLYSDRTISIGLRLDGGDTTSGPGVPARALVVARDAKDRGGSYEVVLWREDGRVPDDAAVLRVAESVLPTVRGWAAGT
ncbi:DUF6215 domain-containing protein [Streptomyces sp. NPDC059651]|uniref:DUF6215 domain-containing protein n=1 Tax=unclassified Streptomyces TaxID=2593676 RepID=UPI003676DA93